MKILLLAQTPAQQNGQNVMVKTLVEGLPNRGIKVRRVSQPPPSKPGAASRWGPATILEMVKSAFAARSLARTGLPDALYYVPALEKRSTLPRDWLTLGLCRKFCPRLVLHWHASGLEDWMRSEATPLQRKVMLRTLGQADLSIVLAPELADDCAVLEPRATVVVGNGLFDPGAPSPRPPREDRIAELLFVGLGSPTKGLFTAIEALELLHGRSPGKFRLVFAGEFAGEDERKRFKIHEARLGPAVLQAVGPVEGAARRDVFSKADLFFLPTLCPHEAQPLALIEAMAYDLPIVTTRWRGIPGMLPSAHTRIVPPLSPQFAAEAVLSLYAEPAPTGAVRQHYRERFTRERHLEALSAALLGLRSGNPQ